MIPRRLPHCRRKRVDFVDSLHSHTCKNYVDFLDILNNRPCKNSDQVDSLEMLYHTDVPYASMEVTEFYEKSKVIEKDKMNTPYGVITQEMVDNMDIVLDGNDSGFFES